MRDDSNGEVHFIIRDLENFSFSTCTTTKNYRFAIFQKNCIFPEFYIIGKIKSSKKDVLELVSIMDKVRKGDKFNFVFMDDDTLKFNNRLCIPHVEGLRRELLKDFHNFRFKVHPGERRYIKI